MKEEWRDIKGYENEYQISNLGRIKGLPRYVSNHTGKVLLKEHFLQGYRTKKGYIHVELKGKVYAVHRLVALHFLENKDKKEQVNHIDGNKANNNVSNLEWCTNAENQIHAYRIGLNHPSPFAGRPKIKVGKFSITGNTLIEKYDSLAEARRKNKIKGRNSIGNAIIRKNKLYGYLWRRIDG